MTRTKKLIISAACLLIVGGGILLREGRVTSPGSPSLPSSTIDGSSSPQPTVFDKSAYSINDPSSIWVIVNKKRPLDPRSYEPSDLTIPNVTLRSNITSDESQIRTETARALEQMFAAADADGIKLTVQSGYRSYDFQSNLYNRYVMQQGKAVADTQSARPGHSEHQTGLAVDIGGLSQPACNVELCFANTAEGTWIALHAHTYGFVIRYPEGQTTTTGYVYEPWHVRYVGTKLAEKLHTDNTPTLEKFFDLGNAQDYN